ncbi:MAG: glycosyltransferase [Bacteroidales bacterium]|jgi:glycosyltransferase involved in cell wall biosynthesis|nr:glycosyltransferase [Bacteroidales bacterium]
MHWLLLLILAPYLYLISRIYSRLLTVRQFRPGTVRNAFVSVVVACRNEESDLPVLLSGIARQTYDPASFELIIVDDCSTDSTYAIASGYKYIKNLRLIRSDGSGKKKALRAGIAVASGELIITTDADCIPGNNWIKTIASFHSARKPDMIIGPVVLESARGFFHKFQELEFLSLQGVTAGTAEGGDAVMCNGANLAFTSGAYRKHREKLHDELPTGDDVFLLHEIKKEDWNRILWLESHDAAVKTTAPGSLKAFIRQRARWISKTDYYSDTSSKVLAIVTFVTILAQLVIFVSSFFKAALMPVFILFFTFKSIPDFLVIDNTAERYGKKDLLKWFIPSQFIYPFYIIAIVLYALFMRSGLSYPFRKGTLSSRA